MEIITIKNKTYTECWNCGHVEWWDYCNPRKTKPRVCPKCGGRFMSAADKQISDEIIKRIED